MGIFSKVLIASDYDGTLVPSTKKVTDKVRAAIRYFISEGGYFTVCTGRTYQGFHSYSPDIINAPALLSNGGMAYDYAAGKIVIDDGIGDEGIDALRDVRDLFPELAIEMYAFNDTYSINLHDNSMRHFTSQGIPFKVVSDPSETARPWSKVMLNGDRESVKKVQAFLAEKHGEIGFVPTDGGSLEVLKKGCNKGTLLLKLAAYLGVDRKDVYAVGDGYNDVDMLKIASAAFVPSNGDEESKACATYIVGSNEEDAIADVIGILKQKYEKQRLST